MSIVNVGNLTLGEGSPKVIVPVMGACVEEAASGVASAVSEGADCIEWRADFCPQLSAPDIDAAKMWLADAAQALRQAAGKLPLLFTIRSADEGGHAAVGAAAYGELVACAISTGAFDMVDIELRWGDDAVRDLAGRAKSTGVASVVSHHDFQATPATEEMIELLVRMKGLGADLPKLAVMAKNKQDTLRLLAATNEAVFGRGVGPVITMAMGAAGAPSRLLGEAFGSAMTFASLNDASAPGQMSLAQTRAALAALHEALQ